MAAGIRLDRRLANLGYGSRDWTRRAIAQGRVAVHGMVERDAGRVTAPADPITLDGAAVDPWGTLLVALHKPTGYACSHDPREGALVYDLLPERWRARRPQVVSIGRLDRHTSGLLLLTDDHALVHRLASPRHDTSKQYLAVLDKPLEPTVVDAFASGALRLDGDDEPCRPATLAPLRDTEPPQVLVTLREGRYHQVRRMFAACGLHVTALHRVSFGPYALGTLEPRAWVHVPVPAAVAAGSLHECDHYPAPA